MTRDKNIERGKNYHCLGKGSGKEFLEMLSFQSFSIHWISFIGQIKFN